MKKYIFPVILVGLLCWSLSIVASVNQLAKDADAVLLKVDKVIAESNSIQQSAHDYLAVVKQPTESAFQFRDIDLDPEVQEYIWELCRQYGVPFEIVLAVAWHESGYQLDALGYNWNGTYDNGLLQVNDVNRGWLEEQHNLDISEPYDSIKAGIIILAGYWHKYTPEQALTAYAWGEAGMLESGQISLSAYRILEKSKEYLEE